MADVLIIDDDPVVGELVSVMVKNLGHNSELAATLSDGIAKAFTGQFDVVLLDVILPDGNGLETLPAIKKAPSCPDVIIMTGMGSPDGAEMAITSGAWDYIEKPPSMEMLKLPLIRVLEYRGEKKARKAPVALKREGIAGSSEKLQICLDLVAQAADSDASVLITGETGTGKELFAWAIHNNSSRSKKNFVVVDCAALPENLVESMLFGHEKGAFTGADKPQEGMIAQAHGGTLFLDEVGELPLATQKAFLRVLQERRYRPLGGKRELESNFRLVAATNRDLEQMVRSGQFREDLLFRLKSISIPLPPLRQRLDDIRDLAAFHVGRLCQYYGIETKGFAPEFFSALASYDWPGNVRELLGTFERVIAVARQDPILLPQHLPVHIRAQAARASLGARTSTGNGSPADPATTDPCMGLLPLQDFRDAMDRQYLNELLKVTGGDIRKACQISGASRSGIYNLLKKYQIRLPDPEAA